MHVAQDQSDIVCVLCAQATYKTAHHHLPTRLINKPLLPSGDLALAQ